MSWNYRLVKHLDGTYGVHEVYYDDNGQAVAMTMNAIDLGNFDLDDEGYAAGANPSERMISILDMIRRDVANREIFEEPEEWPKNDFW